VRTSRTLLSVTVALLALAFASSALAGVQTDAFDYQLGDTVSIVGDGMQPGETVGIDIIGPLGTTVQHDDVTADAVGNFSDSYVLPLDATPGIYTVVATGISSGASYSTLFDPGQSGTTLTASKTATATNTITFEWTIDKSVTPDTWNLFSGDSGTSGYTIAVTKDGGTQVVTISGQICVTNGGAQATQGLSIVDSVTMPPSSTAIASTVVGLDGHTVLAAGESFCYPYSVTIPNASVVPGAQYKDTANVTITNHSGNSNGPSPSATTTMPGATNINDAINVADTNGGGFAFSASGSQSYTKTFTCDADSGTHGNTATIVETGQSDSAAVTVNCYGLSVAKDAATSFTRKYQWTIAKKADPSETTVATGDSFTAGYTIDVGATYADSGHQVTGTITVGNPAPMAATINSLADVVTGVGAASVDCGTATFPLTLPGGGTLTCTYSASLPDATDRTNTATATLQNHAYDSSGTPTDTGTTGFSGDAAVLFGSPTTELDKSAAVSDTFAGTLGTLTFGVDSLPATFAYNRGIGPYSTCGDRKIENTASFLGSDGASGSSAAAVTVHVQCKLTVTKVLVPTTDAGLFNLLIDTVVKASNVGDGGTTGAQQAALGSHTVGETAGTGTTLSQYVSTVDCGSGPSNGTGASVSFASGDSDKTCTIKNTKKGRITVKKTTNGVVDPTKSINFTLTGPGLPSAGVTMNINGVADGVLDFGYALVPGSQYTVCENPVPAGFTSFWTLDGPIVTPYNPNATDNPPQDLGVRCYDFSAAPAQTRAFVIDNSRPGGDPRTIGYWKNWNKCTNGNQTQTAAKNGGASAGFFVVEDLLPQTIGNFTVSTCQQAVKLLSKQDQNGTNRANDAAYGLGSQLLAARFNLAAGAETCSAVQAAVVNAQNLLVSINFTGTGSYLAKPSTTQTTALSLATQLANYNMGSLC
jgi:hypothetical protein